MARRAKAVEKKIVWSQLIMVPINGMGPEDVDTYTVAMPKEELLDIVKKSLEENNGQLWIGSGMVNLGHYRTIEVAVFEPKVDDDDDS